MNRNEVGVRPTSNVVDVAISFGLGPQLDAERSEIMKRVGANGEARGGFGPARSGSGRIGGLSRSPLLAGKIFPGFDALHIDVGVIGSVAVQPHRNRHDPIGHDREGIAHLRLVARPSAVELARVRAAVLRRGLLDENTRARAFVRPGRARCRRIIPILEISVQAMIRVDIYNAVSLN